MAHKYMVKTLIIAEAGVNHNGDIEMAKELVRVAAEAGADLVKFQSFVTEASISVNAPKAKYQIRSTGESESQFDMVKKLELGMAEHKILLRECESKKIGFFSTAFDLDSVEMLSSLALQCFKIPSGEITNLPYLRCIGRLGKEIIMSTGMASMDDIEAAIVALEHAGTARENITVLHCTTEYPAPMEEVNLHAMRSIGDAFGVSFGYSDHTQGTEVAIAAVAMGASVIEKHFTLDRNLPGPDHQASLEPRELASMVRAIRNIELALGDGVKRPTRSELGNRVIARKSIVARVEIKKNEVFSEENITSKRPGDGLSPMLWDDVVGTRAARNYTADEQIEL